MRACVRDATNDRKTGFLKAMPAYATGQLCLHSADMTKPHAYDAVFEGAVCVFHPAEVFMSFATGRDRGTALQEFGKENGSNLQGPDLNKKAMESSQYVVDSINKSSTVRRLVYTSSIAAMVPGYWEDDYKIQERREPNAAFFGPHSYHITKRTTEHFFTYHAMASGGKWSAIIGNPSDIVGPIISPHHATETWQGKVARVVEGRVPEQEMHPWQTVDVRDVAECEIRLAEECKDTMSGQRFLIASGDRVLPEDLGPKINELYPQFGKLPSTKVKNKGAPSVFRNLPLWMRVNVDNTKITSFLGRAIFHDWDETMRAMIDSLVKIGGVRPVAKSEIPDEDKYVGPDL